VGNRRKQNVVIGIVASIGIILILGALWLVRRDYQFSQYTSDEKGFSIKYPADWSFEENTNGAAILFYSPLENEMDMFKENVNIVIQNVSGDMTEIKKYSEAAVLQMEAVFGENMIITESRQIYFAKKRGYRFVFFANKSSHPPPKATPSMTAIVGHFKSSNRLRTLCPA